MKKLMAMMLSLTVAAGLMGTASAAETGSITVTGTTAGKDYAFYQVFDLTYTEGTDGTQRVAYSVDPDWAAFFAGAGAGYLSDTNTGDLNPITVGGQTKYINITDGNVSQFAQDCLDYIGVSAPDRTVTAAGDTAQADGLALGYYLVYPVGASEVLEGYGSLCSLTSTLPDGEIRVKATYPTIDKIVDDADVEIGQEVGYTIVGTVPDTTGYSTYFYKVSDALSGGLNLRKNVTVTIGSAAVTEVTPVYTENGFALTFDMTAWQEQVGEEIRVSYSAVVNENAVIGEDGNENHAVLEYSNNPASSVSTDTDEDVETVYTCRLEINKFDGDAPDRHLSGAKFKLGRTGESGTEYYFFNETTGKVQWVSDPAQATEVVTDKDGRAAFSGIEAGSYSLMETEAPDGYNRLAQPVEVTITRTEENQTVTISGDVADVANASGTVLPSAGGMGTVLFYGLGGALSVTAVAGRVYRSRRKDGENHESI